MKGRKKKKILFYLGHPAHYHNFSIVSKMLEEKGHEVIWVARKKDVLFNLLEGSPFRVYFINGRKRKSKTGIISSVLMRELKMWKIVKDESPDLLIGTDLVITHVGKFKGIPAIVVNEDDAKEIPLLAKYGFQYADAILAPFCCGLLSHENKKIGYEGYQELAYLHPAYFQPDREKVQMLDPDEKPYFILRFAQLSAHHDKGKKGINSDLARQLIAILREFGRVYITAERKLETDLEPYRIKLHPLNMHHALYYASLYIGDSQTMTAEAAVLGTPAVRYNDFVGKLSYLEELEQKYRLAYGFTTSQQEAMLEKVKELVNSDDLKKTWKKRRELMLREKIKVADFWFWFFDNYPDSKTKLEEQPQLMEQFKT